MVIKVEGEIIVAGNTNLLTSNGSQGYTQIEQAPIPFTSNFEFAPQSPQPEDSTLEYGVVYSPKEYGIDPSKVAENLQHGRGFKIASLRTRRGVVIGNFIAEMTGIDRQLEEGDKPEPLGPLPDRVLRLIGY